eukprot:1075992-Rhodomonas_salina.1
MSGTDTAFATITFLSPYAMSGTDIAFATITCLSAYAVCHAIPCSAIAYGATRLIRNARYCATCLIRNA